LRGDANAPGCAPLSEPEFEPPAPQVLGEACGLGRWVVPEEGRHRLPGAGVGLRAPFFPVTVGLEGDAYFAAASFCRNPSCPLRFRRCSPKVCGSDTGTSNFNDLRRTAAHSKNAEMKGWQVEKPKSARM